MEKGRKWSPEISKRLGETPFGIICLTHDNRNAPWILFEAGALSKSEDAYVWTFLHGISPADVEPPLGQFQHTISDKADVRRLLHTINRVVGEQNEKALPDTTLDKVFETFWPELEQLLTKVPTAHAEKNPGIRSDRELLEELLDLARGQQRTRMTGFYSGTGELPYFSTSRSLEMVHAEFSYPRLHIRINSPEDAAKRFIEELRPRLPMASYEMALTPGTDRVELIVVEFEEAGIVRSEKMWQKIGKAAEVAGITVLDWA
jgi:hypothetical protein